MTKLPGKVVGELNGFPVRRVSVDELQGADYNPREIGPRALSGLKRSVKEFGLPQPIVWNRRTQRIVGGHQRLKTLKPGTMTDVVEVDLDEQREKVLNIALNNRHIEGEWTVGLSDILDEIEAYSPDLMEGLNLDDLRMDMPEFEREAPQQSQKEPEPEDEDPRSKPGKTYDLGALGKLVISDRASREVLQGADKVRRSWGSHARKVGLDPGSGSIQ